MPATQGEHIIAGPVQMRPFTLAKICDRFEGHQHYYDHTTLVTRGRIRIEYRYARGGEAVEGKTEELGVDEYRVLKADVFHTIVALTDDAKYVCIFSHRDFDGQIVQAYGPHVSALSAAAKGE